MSIPSPHILKPSRFSEIIFAVVIITECGFVFWPLTCDNKSAPRRAACVSNLKQLSIALSMYSYDYGGSMPPMNSKWSENLFPYYKNDGIVHCPTPENQYGYALNGELGGRALQEINEEGTSFFETSLSGPDVWSDLFTLPSPGRHEGTSNVVTLSGRLIRVKR